MANLAIKGHASRGKEVIEILEMLGGKNKYHFRGDEDEWLVLNGNIQRSDRLFAEKGFTLEEFLEEFPYKVGDKVLINDIENDVYTIKTMVWDEDFNRVNYGIEAVDGIMDDQPWFAHEMVLFNHKKEETMEERKYADLRLDADQCDKLATEVTIGSDKITPPKNYLIGKITEVDNGMLVEFVKKQPQYPKTYKECCDVFSISPYYNLKYYTNEYGYHDYTKINKLCSLRDKLNILGKLLICRDAYWKIAGEKMGLDKPWEPIYTDDTIKYSITIHKNKLDFNGTIERNYVLIFPTKEIRNAFYEYFKELIEQCKELL